MRKKLFVLTLSALLFALCLSAEAQQPKKVARIGFISPLSSSAASLNVEAFRNGLRELGYLEGKNIAIEYRFAEGKPDRLPELVTDLGQLKVDVIVVGSTPGALAAKKATSTIPIVMIDPGDPVSTGLVASLARPGGNITGVASMAPDLAAKRLELVREAFPKVSRVAVLFNVVISPTEVALKEMQVAARAFGQQLQFVEVQGPGGFEHAFEVISKARASALVVFPDPLTFSHQELIVAFTTKSRIPTMLGQRNLWMAGG